MALSPDSQTDPYARDSSADVNAILQGMTDATIDRQQARRDQALPPQVQPNYRAPLPAQIAQNAPQLPPEVQPNQPNYTVQGTGPGTWWRQQQQQQPPIPSQFQQNQQQQPVPLQPPPGLSYRPPQNSELPPVRNMPSLWNSNQVGASGQTKQQFLLGRMQHESQGDPTALNYVARGDPRMYDRGYTASGLLQDTNETWRNGVQWALADPERYPMHGDDPRKYPAAGYAPWHTQWQVNSAIYDHAGETPWREGARSPGFQQRLGGGFYNAMAEPTQQYAPAQPRSFAEWGRTPAGMGGTQPGQMPRHTDFGRIMGAIAPLMVGLVSLAARMPLSTAITAYGAMARAQQNGQQLDYQRQRTHWQDQLKEATAQQTLESRAAADAFSQYGDNNPQGLQQELAKIALQYNDPTMFRMAQNGDLNGIHQLQTRRDLGNQDLTKLHKAAEDEADRQAQDAAVQAMDRKYQQEHPDATPDDLAIAHNEHIGQASKAGTITGGEQEGPVMDVIGEDGKPTGQQVRTGKQGGYYDPSTRQPVQLKKGETVQQTPRRSAGGGTAEGAQVYNVLGADDKPTGRQVRLGKNGGMFDTDGNPATLNEGEHLQPLARPGTGAGAATEGMTPYDVVGQDGKPTGRQVRMGKSGGLYDLNSPPNPVQLGEGESVRPVSRQAPPQKTAEVPDNWEGAPYKPPPNVDPGLWAQAVSWAEQGRPPVGLGGRASSMYQQVEPLVPAAMKSLGIDSLSQQALRYDARRHSLNSIETGFGSGVNGRNLISLNTVADHIGLFREYAEALHTNDIQAITRLRNRLATEAGSPEVIDFALAGRITGDEVVRLLTTTGGTLSDREDIASRLASYNSPEQFEGAANTLTNYVRGRYAPLRQAYARGDPEREREFDQNMVTEEARKLFQGPKAPIPGQDARPNAAPQQQETPQRPTALPQGTQWSPSRRQWRDPAGKIYNEDGSPAGG